MKVCCIFDTAMLFVSLQYYSKEFVRSVFICVGVAAIKVQRNSSSLFFHQCSLDQDQSVLIIFNSLPRPERIMSFNVKVLSERLDASSFVRERMRNDQCLIVPFPMDDEKKTCDGVASTYENLKHNAPIIKIVVTHMVEKGVTFLNLEAAMLMVELLYTMNKRTGKMQQVAIYKDAWAVKRLIALAKRKASRPENPKDNCLLILVTCAVQNTCHKHAVSSNHTSSKQLIMIITAKLKLVQCVVSKLKSCFFLTGSSVSVNSFWEAVGFRMRSDSFAHVKIILGYSCFNVCRCDVPNKIPLAEVFSLFEDPEVREIVDLLREQKDENEDRISADARSEAPAEHQITEGITEATVETNHKVDEELLQTKNNQEPNETDGHDATEPEEERAKDHEDPLIDTLLPANFIEEDRIVFGGDQIAKEQAASNENMAQTKQHDKAQPLEADSFWKYQQVIEDEAFAKKLQMKEKMKILEAKIADSDSQLICSCISSRHRVADF